MRGSRQDLPVALEGAGGLSRQAEWGDLNVALETYPAGTDPSPLLRGLPDDRCQCPHWGYVLKGRLRVTYRGREETVNAGDAYYLAPGHVPFYEEETELVEFSPRGEYQTMLEVVAGNLAAPRARPGSGEQLERERRRRSVAILTRRQNEVAALVAGGLTNHQIAAALAIAERTAETHVEHILRKLGLASRTQVSTWALERGLVGRPPG